MLIHLYSFSKAPNSTSLPSDTGREVEGELNEQSSITAPYISFGHVEPAYNYAYIPVWNRYYFIQNWEYTLGLWQAHMAVDVLATYKDGIGASTQYVLRSSSSWDGAIVDRTYPTTQQSTVTLAAGSVDEAWSRQELGEPCFILGVSTSTQHFYRMDSSDLASFFHYLYSDGYINQLYDGDWATEYPQLKINLNPIQYVDSLMWYPFSPAAGSGGSIQVGWGDVPVSARTVPTVFQGEYYFTPPRHPQSASRGSYLNLAPMSEYTLSFPPWGIIQLDSFSVSNATTVGCKFYVDFTTGAGTLNVYLYMSESDKVLVESRTAQVGVAVQYSAIVSNGFGLAPNAQNAMRILGAAGALAQGEIMSGLGSVANMLGDAVEAALPYGGSTNTGSGRSGLKGPLSLVGRFANVVDEDLPHRGRPLCTRKEIGTLAGYVQCSNVEIDLPDATYDESQAVTRHMEGGFLYE